MTEKRKIGFNIVKNDSTDGHGGFGVGALSLENISPVFVDVLEKQHLLISVRCMHVVQ